MRILYIDEAGVGSLEKDPIMVVAGVIIHADTQWRKLADHMDALLKQATPKGAMPPRCLHAKDIFHGTKEFHRDHWPAEVRHQLLRDIAALPALYGIPIAWAAADRKRYAADFPQDTHQMHTRDCYTVCAVACFMQAELYMREVANRAEVCSVIMEENTELQRRVPELIDFLRGPPEEERDKLVPGWQNVIPLQKIIDTPASQPKTASSILQLADFCAFAIKRRAEKKGRSELLTGPLAPQLLLYKSMENINNDATFWIPIMMPSKWGNHNITLKGGKFVKQD